MNQLKLTFLSAFACAGPLLAHEQTYELPDVDVEGRKAMLVGEAISASEGFIGRVDLETRPMLRVGELLEAIPGMIATQHSAAGKANQYFFRGFNLDHGTDFATFMDGMPVNMVSHGHGQGYTDLNFIIPELTASVNYKKGSYHASVGDFSSAGSASIRTLDSLDNDLMELSVGEYGLYRGLIAGSQALDDTELVFGFEKELNDGPWEKDENFDKTNGLLKFVQANEHSNFSISLMGYGASWDSTDQIPERAVSQGLISKFGALDDSTGGRSSRYSLSTRWIHDTGDAVTDVSLYSIYYDLNLWSNFTYFLDDPIDGDQFEQVDKRMTYGLSASRSWHHTEVFNKEMRQTLGLQFRFDDIDQVGLYRTRERQRLSTTREDAVEELASSLFYESQLHWNNKLRSTIGLRADQYDFDVDSNLPINSGTADDFLLSPKFNTVYTANESLEYYFSSGYAFHSNDARGTTITIDPASGEPVDAVDPLVRSKGAEIGLRYYWNQRSNTSISLWTLDLDSELLFVGDAGNTEATRPTGRHGMEVTNYFSPYEWLSFDVDVAFTEASFDDNDPAGRKIPGSIDTVASGGINVTNTKGWFGSLRLRHFGNSPLIEDNSVSADSFFALNLRVGFQTERWKASMDILNMLDSSDNDITYFYASRLPGETPEGVEDKHFHIIPPRMLRLNIGWKF